MIIGRKCIGMKIKYFVNNFLLQTLGEIAYWWF